MSENDPSDEEKGPRKEVTMKVDEARQRDVGKSIIRINNKTMSTLDLRTGDIVEVEGKKIAAGIAWPTYPQDQNMGIIRIDARLRRNVGVELQETVIIRKAQEKVAKSISLAPSSIKIRTDSRFESFVKRKFLNYPVTIGDEIYISIGISREICFTVTALSPKGICIVKQSTALHLHESPMAESETGIPFITYEDIGGLSGVIKEVRELIELPLDHPEIAQHLQFEPPRGILLIGPSGCGKTLLVKALASQSQAHFIAINAPEIFSKFYGESEKRLRQYFIEAEEHAPSIIYIDKIEAIALNRDFQWEEDGRVTAQLEILLDGLKPRGKVYVIAETSQPDLVDAALRRPGRFEREIVFPMPTEQDRLEIFAIHVKKLHVASDIDLKDLTAKTPGLLGADIAAICREACMSAIRRKSPSFNLDAEEIPPEDLEGLVVTRADFEQALTRILSRQTPPPPSSDQVALRIAHHLLARLKSERDKEILMNKMSPDTGVAQKVIEILEVLLEKRTPLPSTAEEGILFPTKLLGVFFCQRSDGTYWLVRKGPNPPNPNALLT